MSNKLPPNVETSKILIIDTKEKKKAEAVEWLHNLYKEQQNYIIKIKIDDNTKKLIDILAYSCFNYLYPLEYTFCSCMDLDKCKCTHGETIEHLICYEFFYDYWKPNN